MRMGVLWIALITAALPTVAAACPPAPTPAPAVSVASPAAQAFAQAGALPTLSVVAAPASVAVQPVVVQPAVVSSTSCSRTGLLADLRLAHQAARAARKAVLGSRCHSSTAVSQAIAVQRGY